MELLGHLHDTFLEVALFPILEAEILGLLLPGLAVAVQ